jgi:hypothetical protein
MSIGYGVIWGLDENKIGQFYCDPDMSPTSNGSHLLGL